MVETQTDPGSLTFKEAMDELDAKYGLTSYGVEASSASEADSFVRTLADEGYPLIICLDWVIIDYVKEVSKDYPDQLFVVLGKSLPGAGTSNNLIEPYTALHEWNYMATFAMIECAMDDRVMFDYQVNYPGATVASIAGGESKNSFSTRSAQQQCVQRMKEVYGVEATVINDYTGSYTDSELNQTIAENLVTNMGVECFFPCVGTGAIATFTTAKKVNAFAFGCDTVQDDMMPGYIPGSILHDTYAMVTNCVTQWLDGTLVGTNEYYWGLESKVVGVNDMSFIRTCEGCNQESWQKIRDDIEKEEEAIKSGDFIVYNYFVENDLNPNAGEFKDWQEAHPGVDYTEWVKAGRPE